MDVIDELIACCEAWEPEVCVMGNVRAGRRQKPCAASVRI